MRQIVVFLVEEQQYGVDIGRVYEIIRSETPVRLPGMPAHMDGVIHLRERIIPVVDLAARLGLASTGSHADSGRIVIVDAGDGAMVGLRVDAVQEVRNLPDGAVQPPVNTGFRQESADYVEGIALDEDQLIIMLDVGQFFGRGEAALLARTGKTTGKEVAAVV